MDSQPRHKYEHFKISLTYIHYLNTFWLVTYLYCSSLKKYSEVKLTSLPLSLASSDTEKWSELLEDVEDTT